MSINGWIKILSIIFQVDVSKRLDSVAIDYDALNGVLATFDNRKVKVLQLIMSEGKTLRQTAEIVGVNAERVRQIKLQAIRQMRGGPSRIRIIHNAVAGWWNLIEEDRPVISGKHLRRKKTVKSASQSCLVITNFNKPLIKVETVTLEKRVEVEIPVERKVFRQPQWHNAKVTIPEHGCRLVATDWDSSLMDGELFRKGPMWLAVFDDKTGEFICGDGVRRKTITHWCALPIFQTGVIWSEARGIYNVTANRKYLA